MSQVLLRSVFYMFVTHLCFVPSKVILNVLCYIFCDSVSLTEHC